MAAEAAAACGEHDFANFAKAPRGPTTRTVWLFRIAVYRGDGGEAERLVAGSDFAGGVDPFVSSDHHEAQLDLNEIRTEHSAGRSVCLARSDPKA